LNAVFKEEKVTRYGENKVMYLKSNCRSLDVLLGGGVEKGTITELFGEGGAGKTNLCLLFAKQCVLEGKKVIYVDTEGVSSIRMSQIFGENTEKITNEILFFKPFSLEEQSESLKKVKNLVKNLDIGLVIIDTMTVFYRKYFNGDKRRGKRGRNLLAEMMIDGLSLSRKSNIPLILTNQVYTDVENHKFEPVGGHVINHNAKAIVEIQKLPDGLRKAIVIKHRSIKSGSCAYFRIVEEGLAETDLDIPDVNSWAPNPCG